MLDHASRCNHCGPLLHQALEDLAPEISPQEEARITALTSATPEVQRQLAATLCQQEDERDPRPARKTSRTSWLLAFLSLSRVAFATALAGVVGLGIMDYRLAEDLSSQKITADAQIARLQSQLTKRTPAPTETVFAADVTLDPGITRGLGQIKHITLTSGTEFVKVSLRLPDIPRQELRKQLFTADRRQIWSETSEPSNSERTNNVLLLLLPSYLLPPNDYQIVVSRESPNGLEPVSTYAFRVNR